MASLRLRLTLAFALGMAVVLAALGLFLYLRLGSELLNGIDLELRYRAGTLLRVPPGDLGLVDPDEAFGQVLDRTGRIIAATPAVREAPMLPPDLVAQIDGPRYLTRTVTGVDDPARLLALRDGDRVIVVGATLGDRDEALGWLLVLLAAGGPVALALSSAAGWALAGAALRPVERMRAEAAAISESEPDRRLHVPRGDDELTRLARTLNAMLGRLQEALRREQRFVDEASHELRTPLAILKAELDVTLARPRTPAELETALRAAADETDRLVLLAEDMLVLARTRNGRLPVRRTPTPLRPLIEGAAASFGAEVGPVPDETVLVDPVRLRQALHNLLDNAVRHGRPPIRVTARRAGALSITVEDAGQGFDGRPEGLGLTVVRAVAESHAGHVVVGEGARVEVVLDA